jgi:hypothetical protein
MLFMDAVLSDYEKTRRDLYFDWELNIIENIIEEVIDQIYLNNFIEKIKI